MLLEGVLVVASVTRSINRVFVGMALVVLVAIGASITWVGTAQASDLRAADISAQQNSFHWDYATYDDAVNAFLADARWLPGNTWTNDNSNLLGDRIYGYGCYGYAVDFSYFVFGSNFTSGTRFTDPSEIKAGDCIRYRHSGGYHSFVVLSREGDSLRTSEGNMNSSIYVSDSHFSVSGNTLLEWGSPVVSFEYGYHPLDVYGNLSLGNAVLSCEAMGYLYRDWRTGEFVNALPYSMVSVCPSTKLTFAGQELKEGSDYTLSYAIDRVGCKGVITAEGLGAFAGTSKSVSLDIIPENISACTVSGIVSKSFTGGTLTQKVSVSRNGETFSEGTDYTISYRDNVYPGTATVTITGKGVLAGTVEKTFKIIPKTIAIPAARSGLVYSGKAQMGVTGGEGYSVKGNAAIDAGSYTATLTADSNHVFSDGKASAAMKWSIAKASQTISAKNATATAKAKKAGKTKSLAKSVTVDLKKKAKASAKTKVAYKKANKAGGKLIAVNKKSGKVTLKKGLNAGVYKVKVKLTASKSKNYKAAKAKTITLTVRVK